MRQTIALMPDCADGIEPVPVAGNSNSYRNVESSTAFNTSMIALAAGALSCETVPVCVVVAVTLRVETWHPINVPFCCVSCDVQLPGLTGKPNHPPAHSTSKLSVCANVPVALVEVLVAPVLVPVTVLPTTPVVGVFSISSKTPVKRKLVDAAPLVENGTEKLGVPADAFSPTAAKTFGKKSLAERVFVAAPHVAEPPDTVPRSAA